MATCEPSAHAAAQRSTGGPDQSRPAGCVGCCAAPGRSASCEGPRRRFLTAPAPRWGLANAWHRLTDHTGNASEPETRENELRSGSQSAKGNGQLEEKCVSVRRCGTTEAARQVPSEPLKRRGRSWTRKS